MSKYDPEIEQLKAGVNCAALLERMGGGYKLDGRESSRNNLKPTPSAQMVVLPLAVAPDHEAVRPG